MPIINVTLMEGYDSSLRTNLAIQLTDVVCSISGAVAEDVTVIINDVPESNYRHGGQHRKPGAPPAGACALVSSYLSALEKRDMDTAKEFLGENFSMTFPGSQLFHTPEQLTDWARQRYKYISKAYERFDKVVDKSDTAVYCYGTLEGVWLDGRSFSGIRFIDRFTVANGKLIEQQVWNDLAEYQLL